MIVPAYTMAPNAGTLKLLRVVIREDFSHRRAQTFLRGKYLSTSVSVLSNSIILNLDLVDTIKSLDKTPVAVHDHAKAEHEANTHQKRNRSSKHSGADDSHSLQGKHGKTHGIC